MTTIYINGCSTCGYLGHQVRRVKRTLPDVEVKNSRYDADARFDHAALLNNAGLSSDSYAPIIVVDGEVTRLEEWTTSN